MNKNMNTIWAHGHLCDVFHKNETDKKLKSWKNLSGYKNVELKPLTDVIKSPDTDIEAQCRELINASGIAANVWSDDPKYIYIDIDMGDWKHDHRFCDGLMEKVFNLRPEAVNITNDTENDCYGAIHIYKIP